MFGIYHLSLEMIIKTEQNVLNLIGKQGRKNVKEKLGIPVFDVDSIESLLT